MTGAEARRRINRAFRAVFRLPSDAVSKVIPPGDALGKLYEAYVLAKVASQLAANEGLRAVLVNSTALALKASGGRINRSYPYVKLIKSGTVIAELWTDIFVTTLSCKRAGRGLAPLACDYHEIDIVMVPPNTTGYPSITDIMIAVECKATSYGKNLLREILGVRRELSLLADPTPTGFVNWPRPDVPATPPSCVLVYSTDGNATQWQPAGDVFGVDFVHCPVV